MACKEQNKSKLITGYFPSRIDSSNNKRGEISLHYGLSRIFKQPKHHYGVICTMKIILTTKHLTQWGKCKFCTLGIYTKVLTYHNKSCLFK